MPKSVQGTYRNGKIELEDPTSGVRDETRVIVTFLESNYTDLGALGIDEAQAADLRGRLPCFIEDWESPKMDMYDDYDSAKNLMMVQGDDIREI
jgi:hypothetical protein